MIASIAQACEEIEVLKQHVVKLKTLNHPSQYEAGQVYESSITKEHVVLINHPGKGDFYGLSLKTNTIKIFSIDRLVGDGALNSELWKYVGSATITFKAREV